MTSIIYKCINFNIYKLYQTEKIALCFDESEKSQDKTDILPKRDLIATIIVIIANMLTFSFC